MVIKQLLELTGAGPREPLDGTFYLASLLFYESMLGGEGLIPVNQVSYPQYRRTGPLLSAARWSPSRAVC